MKKVYLVRVSYDYEGESLISVHRSLKGAMKKAETYAQSYRLISDGELSWRGRGELLEVVEWLTER